MAEAASHASFLVPILVFCGAAVVAVPLFRLMGLGAILGYLVAGIAIGPSGLRFIAEPETVRGVAELGVVLLLFIVGLELKVSRLLSMRRDIVGLGLAQLFGTGAVIAAVAMPLGLTSRGAIVTGAALALSATAIALQILQERGDLHAAYGTRTFAVLLFQDLAIVPMLALTPLLANAEVFSGGSFVEPLVAAAKAIAAIVAVVLVGRFLLNPVFRALATSGAREVMTAAALLVVLGTAVVMDRVGLSMAMGAFMAGLLLAESNFRHQLEADIEPFRGLLLGLFFMSVGMSLDVGLVKRHALLLALATPLLVFGKIAIAAILARVSGSQWRDALRAGALLATAGEFAFVLLPVAGDFGLLSREQTHVVTALAALSMLFAPLAARGLDAALASIAPPPAAEPEPMDFTGMEQASVIVVGFGRFGQVVNQILLSEGIDVTVIDHDIEQIRAASGFGFKIFYGDGTRLDVLRAAGAGQARIVCVCIENAETATRIVELLHAEFPQTRTYVRAFDRRHALELMQMDTDHIVRETFYSALAFGQATLEGLGIPAERAEEVTDDVRKRDMARLVMQKTEGLMGGADLLRGVSVKPQPLTAPKARSKALTQETRDILGDEGERL
jgi:monovalent cation:proton antiporter-2 (CPA2) family protein